MTPPSELPIIPEAPMQTAVDVSKVATMNEEVQGGETKLASCPFCGSTDIDPSGWATTGGIAGPACNRCQASAGSALHSTDQNIAAWNRRASSQQERGLEVSDETGEADTDRMQKISEVIAHLQSIQDRFGNTCVYIRRGGMSWGAVALNRRDDDKNNGVFDLQAQHDRDMAARLQQVQRLVDDNRELRARAALLAASSVSPATGFEVKALEWQGSGWPKIANFAVGQYQIWANYEVFCNGYIVQSDGRSFDSAKAAAQADFDRRVRSCLAPQPSVTKESEMQACGQCQGSGFDGHPDCGSMCRLCGGSGGIS